MVAMMFPPKAGRVCRSNFDLRIDIETRAVRRQPGLHGGGDVSGKIPSLGGGSEEDDFGLIFPMRLTGRAGIRDRSGSLSEAGFP